MHFVLNHPLVSHRMAIMRDRQTPPKIFRELVNEITVYMAYCALGDLRLRDVDVVSPVARTKALLVDEHIVLVPILRAGMGMLDAMLGVLPYAKVGVLGMQRNEKTAEPEAYYAKVPKAKGDELAILLDPMIATGGSACDAVAQLKKLGYKRIKFMNIISAPEGISRFEKAHPDVPVYSAAKDEYLNEDFYIVPGLGDAGDRIFGTL